MEKVLESNIYGLMQTGNPYKSYIKTIVGKVYVNVVNPFTKAPEGRILVGNPRLKGDDCIVDTWSEMEDVYFKRMNRRHFEQGNIIEFKRSNAAPEKSPNEITDDELVEILSKPFLALQNRINKMTSVAPVWRAINKAKELEKSEKIIKFLEGKLASIQALEYEKTGE